MDHDIDVTPTDDGLEFSPEKELKTTPGFQRGYLWDANTYFWKPYQLDEWQKHFANCSRQSVEKKFEATTQLIPSVKQKNEMYSKGVHICHYPYLTTRRLKESIYCDPVDLTKLITNATTAPKDLIFLQRNQ